MSGQPKGARKVQTFSNALNTSKPVVFASGYGFHGSIAAVSREKQGESCNSPLHHLLGDSIANAPVKLLGAIQPATMDPFGLSPCATGVLHAADRCHDPVSADRRLRLGGLVQLGELDMFCLRLEILTLHPK